VVELVGVSTAFGTPLPHGVEPLPHNIRYIGAMPSQPASVEKMAEELRLQFGQDAVVEAIKRGGERVRVADVEGAQYWVEVWSVLENGPA
jgi:hypothetical protein